MRSLSAGFSVLVAPHAGAWIETTYAKEIDDNLKQSHPTRVRGLKLRLERKCCWIAKLSHPTRVRGLKHSPWVRFGDVA